MGVAQVSILGPVLFTLYEDDLLSVPKKCEAMGYVDDTMLLLALFRLPELPFLTLTGINKLEQIVLLF